MKYFFAFILLAITCSLVNAQHELSVFSATGRGGVSTTFVTDYHSLGINPANLGLKTKYEAKHITIGFLETGLSFYTEGQSEQRNYQ